MNRINFNGQNSVATSAVNVEVFYITSNSTKKVVNAFKSVEEIREINEIISESVAYGKKDFYLYYKIGDFVDCFLLDKDYYSGNYVLCYGNERVDLGFTKLVGKNIDTLESAIFRAINKMLTKSVQKIAKEIASEKNEIIESMVENETSFNTHIFNSFGLFEYLYPNQDNRGVYYWVEQYVEEYYTECMKKKLVKKYNLNYDLDSDNLTFLFRDYMDMLEKKWDFENALLGFENVVENAPKNNTPILDNDIDRGIERVADTIEKYLGSYMPSYLDKFGDCVITIYWDSFTEQDMEMLIENDIFAMSVRDTLYERGVIENLNGFLVYDDGVYVTVDYDKMFNKVA